MVNWFCSASRGSGIALAAMVMAAMPGHRYDSAANAQGNFSQNPAATHIIGHAVPASGETSGTITKVDVGFVPSGFHHY